MGTQKLFLAASATLSSDRPHPFGNSFLYLHPCHSQARPLRANVLAENRGRKELYLCGNSHTDRWKSGAAGGPHLDRVSSDLSDGEKFLSFEQVTSQMHLHPDYSATWANKVFCCCCSLNEFEFLPQLKEPR
jgi:hypothetical protein